MIWLFEREGESLRLETRYDNATGEFVLVTHRPDGPQIERFTHAASFRQRLVTLEQQLHADRWRQQGTIWLHDGWKIG